jgi:transcription antitermination factor NusG
MREVFAPAQSMGPQWYAIFTMPKHEKSVVRHFDYQNIYHFLPVYEDVKLWANRQRICVKAPLFPRYLFARFDRCTTGRILKTPGVLQIVGTAKGPIPVPESQIELLRTSTEQNKAEPCSCFEMGSKVRISRGPMTGIEGTLVQQRNKNRFVFTLSLIRQSASIEIDANMLEQL